MLKEYIKNEWKEIIAAVAVCLVIAALCIGYIYYIGGPITEARNKFNDGVKYMETGDYIKAKSLFEESNKLWWTAETDNYILQVNSRL